MSNPEGGKLNGDDLRFKKSRRQLVRSSFSESDVPSAVPSSEFCQLDGGTRLRLELPIHRVHGGEELTETRVELRDGRVSVRTFKGGNSIEVCAFEGVDSLVLRLDQLLDGRPELTLVFHDSSPSVGGCGDPQPTEGEARKGDSA